MFQIPDTVCARIDEARKLAGTDYHLMIFAIEHDNKGTQVYAVHHNHVDMLIYSISKNLDDYEARRRCTAFREYLERPNVNR